jgi:hypothetical protein
MNYLIKIFYLVGLLIFPQIVFAKNLTCNPQTTKICDIKSCNNAIPEITISVDIENKKYARCVNKECKSYNALVTESGVIILVNPTVGTFIKINKLDNSFVDVATLLNIVFLNFGFCDNSE